MENKAYNLFQMTMNNLQKVLRSATEGDEDALASLKLDNVQPIDFTKVKELTVNNINLAYQTVAKIRSAAQVLRRESINQTARYLMEALHFMQDSIFKQLVSYDISKEDVLQSVETQLKDVRAFCVDSGEEEEASFYIRNLDWVASKVRDALTGDEEALSLIGLEKMPSLKISRWKKTPGYSDLSASFGAAVEMAQAGRYMGDRSLESVCTLTLSFLEALQRKYHSKEKPYKFHIDGADVSHTLLSEVSEIKKLTEDINQIRVREREEDDPEDSVTEEKDPTYSPLKDDSSGSSVISPSDTDDPEKRKASPTPKKRKASPAPKKRKTSPAPKKRKASPTPDDIPKKKKKKSDKNKTEEKKVHKGDTRSHHAVRKCPVCKKEQKNLPRHLQVHVKRNEISEEDVGFTLSVAARRKRKRASTKERRLFKWCPVKDCKTVTAYLRSHLTHYHRVKGSTQLDQYVKLAYCYQGSEEVEKIKATKTRVTSKEETPLPLPSTSPLSAISTKVTPPPSTRVTPPPSTRVRPLPSTRVTPPPSTRVTPPSSTEVTPSPLPSSSPTLPVNSDPFAFHSDDSDFDPEESVSEYFKAKSFKNERHRWMCLFYQELNKPDLGRKTSRNRLQHASHVRKILEDLEPNGTNINVLSGDEGNIVWTDWVDPKMESLRAGTIRSYLGSYEMFLDFVTRERVRAGVVPELDTDVAKILRNTVKKLKGWRKTVDIEKRPEKYEKVLEETDMRLTNKDVEEFKNSEAVSAARDLLKQAEDGAELSISESSEVRDFLLCLVTIKTGQRPGALENATIDHYKSMRQGTSGNRVMLIPAHKRGISGPAPIALDAELQEMFQTYVEKIRPRFSPNTNYLFCTTDGEPFRNGRIARRLPEFWQRSGVRPDLRITATNIRKWIVTECHEKKRGGENVNEQVLRESMCHSDITAKTFYLRQDLTEVASQALSIIAKCTEKTAQTSPPSTKTDEARPLTEEEKGAISMDFSALIQSDSRVFIENVRKVIEESDNLKHLKGIKGMDQRVADRVRFAQASYASKRDDSEEDSDRETASVTSSGARKEWTKEETKAIREGLEKFGKCPSRIQLPYFFTFSPALRDIFANNDFKRCMNKVKNDWKRRNK